MDHFHLWLVVTLQGIALLLLGVGYLYQGKAMRELTKSLIKLWGEVELYSGIRSEGHTKH